MFFAYKYAKKKYAQRGQQQIQPETEPVGGSSQPGRNATKDAGNGDETDAVDTSEGRLNREPRIQNEDESPSVDLVEKKRKRKYRWKIIFGLMTPFTLQSLDMTIIATALPYIATDFSKFLASPEATEALQQDHAADHLCPPNR